MIIRVFPRRTMFTPNDDYAFVGEPPMIRPDADEVHISIAFSWDLKEGRRLAMAWRQYYPEVIIGGPAFNSKYNSFTPGEYIKQGVTFTSRGCNNQCPWCLVPKREGRLKEIKIKPGNIIQDNNFFQCSQRHISSVVDMLKHQRAIQFTGGLDSRLLTDPIAVQLRDLNIRQLFFACDTNRSLKSLEKARLKLNGFTLNQLRCYVLLAYNGETMSEATERLESVLRLGFLPFAQLYQPEEKYIEYSKEWRRFQRMWSRPAIIKAIGDCK